MQLPDEIVRYHAPNKHDHAPYGRRCKVDIDENFYDLYIQLGQEDEPQWEYMGKFRKDEQPTIKIQVTQPDL